MHDIAQINFLHVNSPVFLLIINSLNFSTLALKIKNRILMRCVGNNVYGHSSHLSRMMNMTKADETMSKPIFQYFLYLPNSVDLE